MSQSSALKFSTGAIIGLLISLLGQENDDQSSLHVKCYQGWSLFVLLNSCVVCSLTNQTLTGNTSLLLSQMKIRRHPFIVGNFITHQDVQSHYRSLQLKAPVQKAHKTNVNERPQRERNNEPFDGLRWFPSFDRVATATVMGKVLIEVVDILTKKFSKFIYVLLEGDLSIDWCGNRNLF